MNSSLSFKDTVIISLSLLTIYLICPRFQEFYETFKKDIKEFDQGIPEIEMDEVEQTPDIVYGPRPESYYSKDKEESDFSDISNAHIEDFDKFRRLFKDI